MNIRYIILIILSILFWRHGHTQYPAAGTKQRLGYQTTGDGLVFRGNGAPAYTPTGLNNAWTYLDTVSRNIYTYVGGAWQLVSGGGSAFDGHVDSLVFNTNVTVIDSTAKMYWDANSETISVGVDGGAVYQMGEELFYPLVINKSGATILNGQLVMVDTATLVTGDKVRIILARNGATYPSSYIMGVATTDISNDSTGLVTWFGYVREVKHADIAQTGVTLVPGNILYASATEPGRYTNVAPASPAHKSTIALVVRKPSDNNMTLLVRPWLAPRLSDLSDVNTSSVTGLSVLRYNSTTGIWDASATPGIVAADTASMLSPYLRKVDTLSLSNRINLKLNISDTTAMLAPYAKGSSTAGRVAYWNGTRDLTGSANLIWTEANKTLGINTTTTSGANLIIKNTQEPTRTTVVANQTFGADTTNWTRGSGWTFNGTQAVATAANGDLKYSAPFAITSGNGYEITFTISNYASGAATVKVGDQAYILPQINQTSNVILLSPVSIVGGFRITGSNFTGNFDNISVVEINNPTTTALAIQSSTSSTLIGEMRFPNISSISLGGGGSFTTGTGQTHFGQEAGFSNTTGLSNVFMGFRAGYRNTTGIYNNYFGQAAGLNNTKGSYNNFFGFNSGLNNITGEFNNFFGRESGLGNVVGVSNNYFGDKAGNLATGSYNNFFGSQAGRLSSGSNNNFIGREAGLNNTTGQSNDFIGTSSGRDNISGDYNTFIGASAGIKNTIGGRNIAIGLSAGSVLRRGNYNVFLGADAGNNSVNADTLTGSGNILIGYQSGNNIKSGADRNMVIGYDIDVPTADGDNQMSLGNLIFGAAMTGTGTTAAGRMGILQPAPTYVLDINSTNAIRFPVGTTAQRPTGATGVVRYNSDSTKLEYHNGTSWSGLQSTITNSVTGTGTANTAAFWTGTNAVTGGDRYFDNGTYSSFGTQGSGAYYVPANTPLTIYKVAHFGGLGIIYRNNYDGGIYSNLYASAGPTLYAKYSTNDGFGQLAFVGGNIGWRARNSSVTAETAYTWSHTNEWIWYVTKDAKVGILRGSTPSYTLDINATDAIRFPVGTTAQQPTGAAGIVRYNSTNTALEYHNGTAWKTVANTDNTVQTFNFSINIYNASDSVKNITSPANFFLVPANLNGYCIDSYQVKALSGTGTADIQLAKNGSGANTQAISGTTAYNKDTNVTLATGDVIQGQVFNLSAGATLVGLGLTIEIKATCN